MSKAPRGNGLLPMKCPRIFLLVLLVDAPVLGSGYVYEYSARFYLTDTR